MRWIGLFFVMAAVCGGGVAQDGASPATQAAQKVVLESLPFEDRTDFENAKRGFIATIEEGVVSGADGPVYNVKDFAFLEGDAPDTVNPSLWRQSQLNSINGLFEVVEGIYQVRGFDLSNMSIIRGEKGWILIDPLTSVETARAALDLVNRELGERPVTGVILTHSHVDHFGGMAGVVTQEEIDSGKVKVIAPNHFYREAVDENVLAGNTMIRRATFMFGNSLERSATGLVGTGLGQTTPTGTISLLRPNTTILETGQKLTVDGVEIVFQDTPGAEAPAEFMFYFPKFKALCQAEEINHVLHNLYTPRGAKVRSGLLWSNHINEAIELFGDEVEVSFGSHHWPTWGNEQIVDLMKKQRDVYRYIHDETLRLANHGYTSSEIAEMIELPESLAKTFANRDYYGTLSHNSKAQYQLYFGWFDGNPANLNPLPPEPAARKYVEYMGGAASVIERARADIEGGEYRFAATALNHVVFADPENAEAKDLLASAYTQMGYQAESGPWRNFYLTGARELRQGPPTVAAPRRTEAIVTAMSLETLYDFFGVLLNGPKAANEKFSFNLNFPDTGEKSALYVENGVLQYALGKNEESANVTVTIDRSTLNDVLLAKVNPASLLSEGKITFEGETPTFLKFMGLLDRFDLWFNIVTP